MARLVGVCLLGGLLCTLLDQVHVHTGTLAYPHPDVFGQAWWVWPLFIGATLGTVLGYPIGVVLARNPMDLAPRRDRWGTREFVSSLMWFIAVYVSSGIANAWPRALTVVFVGSFVARALADGSPALWLNALMLGVAGVCVEATLCLHGCFYYVVPVMHPWLPVPVWLVGVYLHAAFVVRAALRRGFAPNVYPQGVRA